VQEAGSYTIRKLLGDTEQERCCFVLQRFVKKISSSSVQCYNGSDVNHVIGKDKEGSNKLMIWNNCQARTFTVLLEKMVVSNNWVVASFCTLLYSS